MKENKRFLFFAIVLLMYLSPYNCQADLISLWEFDYKSAMDSCGNNHGTLHGDPVFTISRSGFGSALELNGSDYILINNESIFDITDEITVAAWIKLNRFEKQWQSIIMKGDSAWRLMRESDKSSLAFHLNGITSDNNEKYGNVGVEGKVNVEDGQWHHAAGVYDGKKVYLYIDGKLDRSVDASGLIAVNDFKVSIGENLEKNGRFFTGLIDDVAIFDNSLSEEEVKHLYNQRGSNFIPKGYMVKMTEEAEDTIQKLKPQESIVYLEKKIIEYNKWKIKNLQHIRPRDKKISSNIYVLLARAKEAADYPIEDVIEDYKKSVSQPQQPSHYMPAAILWLFDKIPTEEYISIAKECVHKSHYPCYDIYNVATYLESEGSWSAFELFFNSILPDVKNNISYAIAAAHGFEESETWASKFKEYCNLKPECTRYIFHEQEKIATRHIARKDFKQAAEVYQNILNQCGPHQQKNIYEFKLYECLFNDGRYKTITENIDNFINNNRATERTMVIKATLLKGRSYMSMGSIDQAVNTFLSIIVEYPEAAPAHEANFLVGYCHMLQGNFKEALEAFNLLIKDYPESNYVNKAISSSIRIKEMTE
jgi:TolA-binding protein